jgi:hypothetical protein
MPGQSGLPVVMLTLERKPPPVSGLGAVGGVQTQCVHAQGCVGEWVAVLGCGNETVEMPCASMMGRRHRFGRAGFAELMAVADTICCLPRVCEHGF